MSSFLFYFNWGWEHIISRQALDHQLFLVALMAIYLIQDWKRILILVSAFTIGHSLTLALSVLDWVRVNSDWVEFLIPATIVITCLFNLQHLNPTQGQRIRQYLLAVGFGLIHGMGFANNIRFALASDENLAINLLGFNLGLEVGQLLVVLLLMGLSVLFVGRFRVTRRDWALFLSAAAFALALNITLERIPSL
jgi:hypothetical protein